MSLRRAALAAAVLGALPLLVTPSAQAGYSVHWGPLKSSCAGRVVASAPLADGGRTIGRVELWYSSARGGQNCVKTDNYLAGAVYTMADLQVDDNGNGRFDGQDRQSHDHGDYASYAGASFRNRTDGRCVRYGGVVSGKGYHATFGSRFGWCG